MLKNFIKTIGVMCFISPNLIKPAAMAFKSQKSNHYKSLLLAK